MRGARGLPSEQGAGRGDRLYQTIIHCSRSHRPPAGTRLLRGATNQAFNPGFKLYLPGVQRAARDQQEVGRFHFGRDSFRRGYADLGDVGGPSTPDPRRRRATRDRR